MFASLAAGYANARPAVHEKIIDRLRDWLGSRGPVSCAVDLGCGAGLSTRALRPVASRRIGLEPAVPMLRFSASVDPHAEFAAAAAEAVPLRDASVDLITAAGSLNYVRDLGRAFTEAARILKPSGVFAVYDFSQGTRSRDGHALESWFMGFLARYPQPTGHARPLDPDILASASRSFRLAYQETFQVGLPMSQDAYVAYLMTETNVASAIEMGETAGAVRGWCERGLHPVFQGRTLEVLFPSYIALMVPASA